jgi:hypothetical protein
MPGQPPAGRTQQERREETERKVPAAATALIAPTSRTSPADVRLPARSCRCGARRSPPIPS